VAKEIVRLLEGERSMDRLVSDRLLECVSGKNGDEVTKKTL
jgi:hypothetical protein